MGEHTSGNKPIPTLLFVEWKMRRNFENIHLEQSGWPRCDLQSMCASQSNNVLFMIHLMLYITPGHYLTWLKTPAA